MKARRGLREAIDALFSHNTPSPSEATYIHLVLDCFHSDNIVQAKRIQTHMEIHHFQPTTTFLHNRLLHIYSKNGEISDAQHLFDKMPKRDLISWNALLSAYSRSDLFDDLWGIFTDMPVRDSVSFNTVIKWCVGNGFFEKALRFFVAMQREGVGVTGYTYVSMLQACSKLLFLRCGKQVHGKMVISGEDYLGGNVFVLNALIDMYAKCGNVYWSRFLFDRTVNKNLVTWNSIISGYLLNGQPKKCIALFDEMQLLGLRPDQVTVSNVLGAYFQCGNFDEAREVFDGIKEKDKICWTNMIVGLSQNGKEEDALRLFVEMLFRNVKPDKFTICIIVSSCAKLASLNCGQAVHAKAVRMGVDFDLLVSSALIDMYSKCGETNDAWVTFKMMPNRNVVSWNSMIVGYAQNGKDLDALSLYERMLQANIKPDDVTFIGVLSACVHAGLIDYGQECFQSITKKHGMTPTLDHYACMISLLSGSGDMNKILVLIHDMPYEPNNHIWSTLLSICAKNVDIENAEIATKNLIEICPLEAVPYIMLSNMYASCGRWNDVASIRSLMKNNNVKKLAAYSWIEINHSVHKFVAEDRAHPETEKIYEELKKLIEKFLKAGFIPNTKLVLHDVGEHEKFESICYHSEKLALAFGLVKKPKGVTPIRIMKNIRVCGDCHVFMKFVTKVIGRVIILRDSKRFHHFSGGECSCKDNWLQ